MRGPVGEKKRPAPFSLRLSDEERAALEAKAGGRPLAAYIKAAILDGDMQTLRKRRAVPEADQALLAQILARLGQTRTANNLNQIAKHLNQGTLVLDEELVRDLNAAIADVAWMRAILMQALGLRSTQMQNLCNDESPTRRVSEGLNVNSETGGGVAKRAFNRKARS